MALGDGDLAVSGRITAGNIATGEVFIEPVADTATSETITGLNLQGSGDVHVIVKAHSKFPGDELHQESFFNESPSGVDLYIHRSNTTNTRVYWYMIRTP